MIALMSVALAADSFAISLSSGMFIKHIKFYKALKIALFFGVFHIVMPLIGWITGLGIRELVEAYSHWVVALILIGLGIKMIYEALVPDREITFNPLDNQTLFGLAIVTSIDVLAAGLGLSIISLPLPMIVTSFGLVTFVLSFMGVFLGHYFGNFLEDKAEVTGGFLLIGAAVYILLEGIGVIVPVAP
ncbi:manganese efflux pump [Euhalothece natronophila Z-M001]|uniref:Putative manganese efflux pump MntP n=1 Tax=Euhalothece natronophila Z-M001 TaxID=522448 RepID=A0A5B8NQX0_9CHRO|nr:manganese efflux pump MntP family protein [Euhalothece natronophila]QDZ41474.1 manganese efflux pump [Euhalothece natronophila Z-M001]